MGWKRSSRRNKERSQTMETRRFLGQTFIVGEHRNGKYRLIGAPGTELEGIIFFEVSNRAVARFRDDTNTDLFEVRKIVTDLV